MGRGKARWSVGRETWVTCAVFVVMMGMVHWTGSHSTYLADSFRRFSSVHSESKAPIISRYELGKEYVGEVPVYQEDEWSLPPTEPRVAICLVGGARAFELTGLTIKKYLLDVYNNADVFLHVPVDNDSHKLTLLQNASRLAMARIFEPQQIPEDYLQQQVLTPSNSPNGIQGLLQYFNLVEGCLDMISLYEAKHKFTYDWIVRTRVDGYWNAPMKPLDKFNPQHYHIPYGSQFGGYNDRLGIGLRNYSWTALSRLSLIPQLHQAGYRNMNSESSFKSQMISSNVSVQTGKFPFCILSARKYAWPPGKWGVPVASIESKGSLNGAKCRPCKPVASAEESRELLSIIDSSWGQIGPLEGEDVLLCDSTLDEQPGWEDLYDKVTGEKPAQERQRITNRTEADCIREIEQFAKKWEFWSAPPPEHLCAGSRKE